MTTTVGFAEISTHILIENIIAEIKEQYLADDMPWIVGFSDGKDSTTLLQLIFLALAERLLQIEKDKSGLMRRHNIYKDIDYALKNYLKSKEAEVFAIA